MCERVIRNSIAASLQTLLDKCLIKEWYFNGDYHVVTDDGVFLIRLEKESLLKDGKLNKEFCLRTLNLKEADDGND